MDVVHEVGGEDQGFAAAVGVESAVAIAESEYFPDAIAMEEFEVDGADDVVQAGAESAAGDDGGAGGGGLKEEGIDGSGAFEESGVFGGLVILPGDAFRDPTAVASGQGSRRGNTGFAESRNWKGRHRVEQLSGGEQRFDQVV
jgi:hypothetical protein